MSAQYDFANGYIDGSLLKCTRKHGARRTKVWVKLVDKNPIMRVVESKSRYGKHIYVKLSNSYSVSVTTTGYGSDEGLLEAAVMRYGSLTYETIVTPDVIGYLMPANVGRVIQLVGCLNSRGRLRSTAEQTFIDTLVDVNAALDTI